MSRKTRNKGLIVGTLLASLIGGMLGGATFGTMLQEPRSHRIDRFTVSPEPPVNPAEQRQEMIQLLRSINRHLTSIDYALTEDHRSSGSSTVLR